MSILNTAAGTAKCPKCSGTGDPTDWLPSPGYDGMMRQFKCRSCLKIFYLTAQDGEQLMYIKERQTALREKGEVEKESAQTQ